MTIMLSQQFVEVLGEVITLRKIKENLINFGLKDLSLTPVSDQDRISPYYIWCNIMWTSDENKETYQLWDYWLIQY